MSVIISQEKKLVRTRRGVVIRILFNCKLFERLLKFRIHFMMNIEGK